MSWTTLHLQVSTPLFNGGAQTAGGDADIRVSSLRGAMRFWFRTLAGVGFGHRVQDLLRLENRVFGSTDASSPVRLRVPVQPPPTPPGELDWYGNDRDGQWFAYLMGQGLSKLVKKTSREPRSKPRFVCHATRPYVAPGRGFDLQFRFTDNDTAAVALASLWLMCTYGGVGARVRRGLGGVRIIGVDGSLPDPWTPQHLLTPGLAFYQHRHADKTKPELWVPQELGPCMKLIAGLAKNEKVTFDLRATAQDRPAYPMFSRQYAIASVSGGKSFYGWPETLAQAGEELRFARASHDYPQVRHYRPTIKTPEWKAAINGGSDQFGLGALGLPVNYKNGYTVQVDKGTRKDDRMRRASPLWLRAVGEQEQWRLLSFAFHADFLPDDAAVHLWEGNRRLRALTVTDDDVAARTRDWIDRMRSGGTFVRAGMYG